MEKDRGVSLFDKNQNQEDLDQDDEDDLELTDDASDGERIRLLACGIAEAGLSQSTITLEPFRFVIDVKFGALSAYEIFVLFAIAGNKRRGYVTTNIPVGVTPRRLTFHTRLNGVQCNVRVSLTKPISAALREHHYQRTVTSDIVNELLAPLRRAKKLALLNELVSG